MLSALILKARNPTSLAATLSSLVPGAIEGVVREVVVVDAVDGDIRRVADHAGCRTETSEALISTAAQIKGDWILFVEAGERLHPGWVDLAARHVGSQTLERPQAARFRRGDPQPAWRSLFQRDKGALLLPKAHLVRHLQARRSVDGVSRGLAIRRLREGRT